MNSELTNNTALTTLAGYFNLLKAYSVTASKSLMAFIAGIGIVSELYNLLSVYFDKDKRQRKIRLATYSIGLGLNTLYEMGSALGNLITATGLSFIALAAELVVLIRLAYQTHTARMNVINTKAKIDIIQNEFDPLSLEIQESLLAKQREHRFIKKVELAYSVISTVCAILFIGAIFAPPLAIASIALFTASKCLQTFDNYSDYQFSRYMSRLFTNDQAIKPDIEQELLADKEEKNNSQSIFKSLNISPTSQLEINELEIKEEKTNRLDSTVIGQTPEIQQASASPQRRI